MITRNVNSTKINFPSGIFILPCIFPITVLSWLHELEFNFLFQCLHLLRIKTITQHIARLLQNTLLSKFKKVYRILTKKSLKFVISYTDFKWYELEMLTVIKKLYILKLNVFLCNSKLFTHNCNTSFLKSHLQLYTFDIINCSAHTLHKFLSVFLNN